MGKTLSIAHAQMIKSAKLIGIVLVGIHDGCRCKSAHATYIRADQCHGSARNYTIFTIGAGLGTSATSSCSCEHTSAADHECSSSSAMPLQPFRVHELSVHNYCILYFEFDRAGYHWTQMYHRLPVSSAVDNSARTGVVERLRRTLCTRMLTYKDTTHACISRFSFQTSLQYWLLVHIPLYITIFRRQLNEQEDIDTGAHQYKKLNVEKLCPNNIFVARQFCVYILM